MSAEYLLKFDFLIFQGSVATFFKVRWVMSYGFVANFIRFPAMQKIENRLRFDKVTESLKVGTFLRHSVVYCSCFEHLRVFGLQSLRLSLYGYDDIDIGLGLFLIYYRIKLTVGLFTFMNIT